MLDQDANIFGEKLSDKSSIIGIITSVKVIIIMYLSSPMNQ